MKTSPHPSYQAAVWRATERAAARDGRVWVAAGASLGLRNPLLLARRAQGEIQMAFLGQASDRAWLGLGVADQLIATHRADALATLDLARERLARVETAGLALRDEIRYLGGIAFDPDGQPHPDWPEGTAARWVLPSILVSWTTGATADAFATVVVPVDPTDGPADVIARLDAHFDSLVSWGARLGGGPSTLQSASPLLAGQPPSGAHSRRSKRPSIPRGAEREPSQAADRESWTDRIRSVVGRLDGSRKVVLARQIRITTHDDLDPWSLLERIDPATGVHRFCFRFSSDRSFLGGSPERLVSLRGDRLTSDCLAGTAPRDPDPDVDRDLARRLLGSHKDQAEHAFVSHFLKEALEPRCRTLSIPENPAVVSLPHLHHLYSPVEAMLRSGVTLGDLVGALHPTPAVCGTPRAEALGIIRETEPVSRGWYAGAVGHVGLDTLELAVGIRSVLLQPGQATVFAGGGLVAASDPDAEFEETERKAEPWARLVQELDA